MALQSSVSLPQISGYQEWNYIILLVIIIMNNANVVRQELKPTMDGTDVDIQSASLKT